MKTINLRNGKGTQPPISAAVISNGLAYISGQVAIDLDNGEFKLGDVRHETELTLRNLKRVLEAAGTDVDHVIKCTVYLRDINDYREMIAELF